MKEVIFYTDSLIEEPIKSVVEKHILMSGLPIISASLKPLDFGDNKVIEGKRGYITMIKQIMSCLERSMADYVFFCEHDVLYPQSHFDFTPPRDDIFYYNDNVWRWMFSSDKAITYDRMLPLSCLCTNRQLALNHYRLRMEKIDDNADAFKSREPTLARKWGYEPGTKKKKRGGLTNDDFDTWSSEYPVIDIRHNGTFSSPKCTLESFKHLPTNWGEVPIESIKGWNLKEIWN